MNKSTNNLDALLVLQTEQYSDFTNISNTCIRELISKLMLDAEYLKIIVSAYCRGKNVPEKIGYYMDQIYNGDDLHLVCELLGIPEENLTIKLMKQG